MIDTQVANLGFCYCLTVHRAQRSEWLRVAVIDDYLGGDKARLAHAAATRARNTPDLGRLTAAAVHEGLPPALPGTRLLQVLYNKNGIQRATRCDRVRTVLAASKHLAHPCRISA